MPSGLRTLSSRANISCPSLLVLHNNFISVAFLQMAKFPTGSLGQKYRQMQALWNHVGHARAEAPTQISFGRDIVLIWENIKLGWHWTKRVEHRYTSPPSTLLSSNLRQTKTVTDLNICWLSGDQVWLLDGFFKQSLFRWSRSVLWKASCTEKVFLLYQISVNAMTPVTSQTLRKGHDIKGYERPEKLRAGIIRDASGKGQAYWDIHRL